MALNPDRVGRLLPARVEAALLLIACAALLVSCGASQPANQPTTHSGLAVQPAAAMSWDGYVETGGENDTIRVNISSVRDGALEGHVVFGTVKDALPPAEPTVSQPFQGAPVFRGFEYEILDGRWKADRIEGQLAITQPWAAWCEQQRPETCFPDMPRPRCRSESERLQCNTWEWCRAGICECKADGCATNVGYSLRFDFMVAGDGAEGTVRDLSEKHVHVRLRAVR